jgi:hypothetical protein
VPSQGEVFMNLTNVHWILALALLVMILSEDPRRRWQGALEAPVLCCLCLTGPFVVLFLPLFVARALVRRTRYSYLILVIALACAGWQATQLHSDRTSGAFDPTDPHWIDFWGSGLAGVLLLGKNVSAFGAQSGLLLGLSLLLYGGLTAYALYRRDRLTLALLFGAFAVWLAVAFSHRHDPATVTGSLAYRYSYIPFVCTVWALILVAERWRRLAPVAGVCLTLIALASLSTFRAPPLKNYHWGEASRCLGGPKPCSIPINPEGWHIDYVPPSA